MYFNGGRKSYSEAVHDINGNDLSYFWQMFKHRYWGNVDSAIWIANNTVAEHGGEGEVTAKYRTEAGQEVILFRLGDGSSTLFMTPEEFENGYVDRYRERINNSRSSLQQEYQRIISRSNRSGNSGGLFA